MKKPAMSFSPGEPVWRCAVAKKLLAWFDCHARDLPWRQTRDLYAIWVSEVMLQQTQVATVIRYWKRFLHRFPDVASLAAASEHDVLRFWEGLGYYRRARQLHAAARLIVAEHGGRFPTTYDAARGLPGVGRYTAGAILSIGQDSRLPILEANSIRVLSRLTAYAGDVRSTSGREHLWSVAEAVLPAQRCGAFNQALMELGSEVCTPSAPACATCPLSTLCQAHARGLVERIPRTTKPTNYEDVTEVAVIVRDRGSILLRHCQPGERWAGLWDFPRFPVATGNGSDSIEEQIASRVREAIGLKIVPGPHFATLKHGVTRFRITLHCYEATKMPRTRLSPGGNTRWVPPEELADYPLSTTGRKISQLLAEARREAK